MPSVFHFEVVTKSVRCDEEGFTPPGHTEMGDRHDEEDFPPSGHVENCV